MALSDFKPGSHGVIIVVIVIIITAVVMKYGNFSFSFDYDAFYFIICCFKRGFYYFHLLSVILTLIFLSLIHFPCFSFVLPLDCGPKVYSESEYGRSIACVVV